MIRVFVISMTDAIYRRARIQKLMGEYNIEFEFIEAIDGRRLNKEDLNVFHHIQEMLLSPGEYGCLLSHISVWKRICVDGIEKALILEDDVHISPGLKSMLDEFRVETELIGIYKLETMGAVVTLDKKPVQVIKGYAFHKAHTNHGGTAAYIINLNTAKFLFSHHRAMRRAIDTELFDPERRTILPIVINQCVPSPCIQDMFLPTGNRDVGLKSMIAGQREDKLIFGFRNKNATVFMMKKLFRPFYLWFLNRQLSFQGKMRLKIEYG